MLRYGYSVKLQKLSDKMGKRVTYYRDSKAK